MTPQAQEFIEAAARTVWREQYARIQRDTCVRCGVRVSSLPTSPRACEADFFGNDAPHEIRPINYLGDAPDIPQSYRDSVAIWTGHLESVNGCKLPEIVKAAEAENKHAECSLCGDPRNLHCHRSLNPRHYEATEASGYCPLTHCTFAPAFDRSAFASALITEAIWRGRNDFTGPSWFDEHATFPGCRCKWCECTEPHDRKPAGREADDYCRNGYHNCNDYEPEFIIPPFEFTYEEKR